MPVANKDSIEYKLVYLSFYLIILPVILLELLSGILLYPHMYGLVGLNTDHLHPIAFKVLLSGIPFAFHFGGQILYQRFILRKTDVNFGYSLIFSAFISLCLQIYFITNFFN